MLSVYPPAVFARGGARVVAEGVGLAGVERASFGGSDGLVLSASANAVETVTLMLMPMAFATTKTTV